MELVRGLLILAAFQPVASANTNDTGYMLPNKEFIKLCQREALRLYLGVIDEQRMLHSHRDFWVRLDIHAYDTSEWLVLCDLASGKIIREQKLIHAAL